MPETRPPAIALVLFLALALAGAARAGEPEAPKDPANVRKAAWLHELYLQDASAYGFALDAGGRQGLALRREPVMRWSSESDYHGEVYVWTHAGRPEIVGCIFSGPREGGERSVMHEFHSLAAQPLVTLQRGGSGWEPHEPGIQLEPVPDAGEPPPSAPRRLADMRVLARRFSARMTADNREWDLRLLPQPIYRYETAETDATVVDGAVFAYVWTVGTDPEVLLVLEARRTDTGTRWHYALARFTNREARAKYGDREVWHVDAATAGIFDGVTTRRYCAASVKVVSGPARKR